MKLDKLFLPKITKVTKKRRKGFRRKKKQFVPVIKKRRTDTADTLKESALCHFTRYGYSCYKEIGLNSWGKQRADLVGVNLKSKILVVEIKSSVQDYKTDKKWKSYLPFCDRFFFCISETLYTKIGPQIKKDLAKTGAGLLVLNAKTGFLDTKIRCAEQSFLSTEQRLTLVTRFAWRNGTSKRQIRRKRNFLQEDANLQ